MRMARWITVEYVCTIPLSMPHSKAESAREVQWAHSSLSQKRLNTPRKTSPPPGWSALENLATAGVVRIKDNLPVINGLPPSKCGFSDSLAHFSQK